MKKQLLILLAFLLCSALAFSAQAPITTVSGALTSADGKYFVTDDATRTTIEVRGDNLQQLVGQKVRLTGQMASGANGQTPVLTVSSATRVSAVGGGKAAAAGVKAGLSKGAVAGIVGGAAAGGTVGALYAADVIGGDDDKPASRR